MPATRRGGVHWPHHDHVRRGAPTRLHASAYPAALAGGPRSPAAGDLAGARRPRQRAVREVAAPPAGNAVLVAGRIAEPTRLLSISYAVFCLKKKKRRAASTRVWRGEAP